MSGSVEKPERPILYLVIANILSALAIAGLLFLVAELNKVRSLDGLWECITESDRTPSLFTFRGIVFDVHRDDSIKGEVGSVLDLTADPNLSVKDPLVEQNSLRGTLRRRAFIIPYRIRITVRVNWAGMMVWELYVKKGWMIGKYYSEIDQGTVSCERADLLKDTAVIRRIRRPPSLRP